jgi:hypothetical protein
MSGVVKNRGWIVTFSGTGINLALGILYTWSVFMKNQLKQGAKADLIGTLHQPTHPIQSAA